MAIKATKSMLQGDYSWEATGGDDPEKLKVDRRLFNRHEGYEVVYMINKVAKELDLNTEAEIREVETLINDQLPGNIRGQKKVFDWLVNEFSGAIASSPKGVDVDSGDSDDTDKKKEPEVSAADSTDSDKKGAAEEKAKGGKPFRATQSMLKGEYSWEAIEGDDPKKRYMDGKLFNRHEGYEVLYMINKVVRELDLKNEAEVQAVEELINDDLPGNIRGQKKVFDWLVGEISGETGSSPEDDAVDRADSDKKGEAEEKAKGGKPFRATKSMLKGEYSWEAIEGDDPKKRYMDGKLFNRHEGYEVLYMINKVVRELDLKNEAEVQAVEELINDDLPGNIRGQKKVFDWLVGELS